MSTNKTTLTNLNSFDIDANTINASNINTYKFTCKDELDTLYANNIIAPNLYNIVTPAYYSINKLINTEDDWYNKEVGKLKITSNDYEKYEDFISYKYIFSQDQSASSDKVYYSNKQSPKKLGWYEKDDTSETGYKVSTDTKVDPEKIYYYKISDDKYISETPQYSIVTSTESKSPITEKWYERNNYDYLKEHFYLTKLWCEDTIISDYTVDKSNTDYIVIDSKLTSENPKKIEEFEGKSVPILNIGGDDNNCYLRITLSNISDPNRSGFKIDDIKTIYNGLEQDLPSGTEYSIYKGTSNVDIKFKELKTKKEISDYIDVRNVKITYTYPVKFKLLVIQQYKEYDAEKLDVQNYTINGLNFNVPGGIALLDKDGNYDLSQIKKATTTTYGIVKLAESSSAKSMLQTDNESAVTPAGLYNALSNQHIQVGFATLNEAGKVYIVNDITSPIPDIPTEYLTISQNYLTSYLDSSSTGYTRKSEFTDYKTITDKEIKEIKEKSASGFSYKGQVYDYEALLEITSKENGDVYNVINAWTDPKTKLYYPAGMNYVWYKDSTTGQGSWDALGPDANQYIIKSNATKEGTSTLPIYFDSDGIAHGITSYQGNAASADYATNAGSAINAPNYLPLTGGTITGTLKINADNDFIVHDNQFNFIPDNYNGIIWLNYRTTTGSNGNVSQYNIGNGKGEYADLQANRVFNAVYNDYAECFEPSDNFDTSLKHRIVEINNEGKVELAKEDSYKVIGIISDSYGHMLGGTEEEIKEGKKVPVGLAGTLWVDSYYKISKHQNNETTLGMYIKSGPEGKALTTYTRDNRVVGKVIGYDCDTNRYKVILCL